MGMAEYAIVSMVTIEHVDDKNVGFRTRCASKSGDPDDHPLKTFTCARTEVWTAAIDRAPVPVPLVVGETGHLYLSREGWKTKSADGYLIYGAGTDLPVFKYPNSAAAPRMVSELVVIPSRIVVHGWLAGRLIEIDLVGMDAAQTQDITWRGVDDIEVRLTERGAQRLLGHSAASVRVWPTRIIVAGVPDIDPSMSGEVDILNGELAGLVQRVAFARQGSPITVSLTPDGRAAFHVVPGLSRASHAP